MLPKYVYIVVAKYRDREEQDIAAVYVDREDATKYIDSIRGVYKNVEHYIVEKRLRPKSP